MLPDATAVARAAADVVHDLVARRPAAVLGLATGSSVLGLYEELGRRVAAGTLTLREARGFLLDEYVGLPLGHPQSYRQVIATELLSRVDLDPASVHGPAAEQEDVDAACADYEQAIRDACRNLRTTDLSGTDLYTSCEPCSVCVATMLMAGIARMYYGATLTQSGAVVPRGSLPPPALTVRAQVGLPVESREMLPAEQKLGEEAVAVLKAWVKSQK